MIYLTYISSIKASKNAQVFYCTFTLSNKVNNNRNAVVFFSRYVSIFRIVLHFIL